MKGDVETASGDQCACTALDLLEVPADTGGERPERLVHLSVHGVMGPFSFPVLCLDDVTEILKPCDLDSLLRESLNL